MHSFVDLKKVATTTAMIMAAVKQEHYNGTMRVVLQNLYLNERELFIGLNCSYNHAVFYNN